MSIGILEQLADRLSLLEQANAQLAQQVAALTTAQATQSGAQFTADDAIPNIDSNEAAQILKVSPQTVVRWFRAGRIHGVRKGGQWKTSKLALAQWSNQLRAK
jgi:excisionase family DNA binding protein